MCGIAGYIGPKARERSRVMCNAMIHRGPDAEGFFFDEQISLCIGQRRLSILELSAAGAQPMSSRCGRYVVSHNGEIYNHMELRRETQKTTPGSQYRGSSDTESLLESLAALGLEKTLELCRGAFAFCLYDRQEKTLRFARDRAGEKPLYYGFYQGDFFFSSDLSGLKEAGIRPEIDRDALRLYCNYGYYPAPYTVFKDVYKLPPGCIMTLEAPYQEPDIRHYWDPQKVAQAGIDQPFSGSPQEAVDQLHNLLKNAIQGQLLSDVALGAFLSGGIDSSLVVALMQEASSDPVRTFSIGFWEPEYNEAQYAKEVAQHLGTKHTELYITEQDALDVIPKIPEIYPEPFADSSQIPTYLLSKLTRQQITVSLSGDGGDELFGGYNRYDLGGKAWRFAQNLPLRSLGGKLAKAVAKWPIWPAKYGELLYMGGNVLLSRDAIDAYPSLIEFDRMNRLVLGSDSEAPTYVIKERELYPPYQHMEETMMYGDFRLCLPDDMLVKVDRAGMAASLETRVPLLDKDIIAFAWSLPLEYKIRNGVRKWPLRQILNRYVPESLYERPKMGFGMPVRAWLSGGLSGWAQDLLAQERIQREGFFDPDEVIKLQKGFKKVKSDSGAPLWYLLMFQEWMDRWNKV